MTGYYAEQVVMVYLTVAMAFAFVAFAFFPLQRENLWAQILAIFTISLSWPAFVIAIMVGLTRSQKKAASYLRRQRHFACLIALSASRSIKGIAFLSTFGRRIASTLGICLCQPQFVDFRSRIEQGAEHLRHFAF